MATSDLCTELKKDVKIDATLERRYMRTLCVRDEQLFLTSAIAIRFIISHLYSRISITWLVPNFITTSPLTMPGFAEPSSSSWTTNLTMCNPSRSNGRSRNGNPVSSLPTTGVVSRKCLPFSSHSVLSVSLCCHVAPSLSVITKKVQEAQVGPRAIAGLGKGILRWSWGIMGYCNEVSSHACCVCV